MKRGGRHFESERADNHEDSQQHRLSVALFEGVQNFGVVGAAAGSEDPRRTEQEDS